MDITEVRIKLIGDSEDRLRAFCSITIDGCFVIRDLKIIEGTSGVFVAMPSRKLTGHCPRCGCKNHLKAAFCNQCGANLKDEVALQEGKTKLYADIAHPINSACRELIQDRVIAEYEAELKLSKEPGYVSRYEDDFNVGDLDDVQQTHIDTGEKGIRKPHAPRPEMPQSPEDDEDDFGAGIL